MKIEGLIVADCSLQACEHNLSCFHANAIGEALSYIYQSALVKQEILLAENYHFPGGSKFSV